MSLYENYNITFKDYSETRIPVGVEKIFDIIIENKFKKIVDIGCGSGNYLKKLYNIAGEKQYKLDLLGIDASPHMLSKIPSYIPTKNLILNQETKLNIEKVDMIIINQVIHHLTDETLINLLNECMRVLNNGGILYINTCTYDQVLNGQWWSLYFPDSGIEKFAEKVDNVNKLLLNYYNYDYKINISDPLQNNYYDYDKVFTIEFRNCDSMWSLLTPDELNETLSNIKKDLENNNMGKINSSENYRKKYGQTTSYIFKKK